MKVNGQGRPTQTNRKMLSHSLHEIFGISKFCGRMESASRVISAFAMVDFINQGHIVGNFLSISIVNSLREISKIVLCQCHTDIATDLPLDIHDYIDFNK